MSLLMEALRKAEEAKRQGAGNPGPVTADPAPVLPQTDSVEAGQALSALASETKNAPDAPLEFESLPGIDLPSIAPNPEALPKLPDNLSDLDLEFAPMAAAPRGDSRLNAIFDAPATPAETAPRREASPAAAHATAPHAAAPHLAPATHQPPGQPSRERIEPQLLASTPVTPATEVPSVATVRAAPLGSRIPAAQAQDQSAAQNLFQAKQTTDEGKVSRKNFLIALGLFSLMAVVSIGVYFWLQLQPKNGLSLTANTAPRPTPAPPIAPPPPPLVVPAPPPPPTAAAAAPALADPAVAANTLRSQEEEAAPLSKELAKATPKAPAPDSPIRVTTSRLRLDPALEHGYDAFQKGDLAAAKVAYEAALRSDPNNIDGLNGLAMTHLRNGRADLAEPLFQRALEIDPRNGPAQASLASLRDTADPVQMESRLKTALTDQPDAPHLHFALGNLYAKQSRWADAQQAYFRAMSGDPENPDYLFNLAVSLDRLHQIKLARQFYDQALAAATKRPAGFDRPQVEERLKKLQP